MSTHLGRLTTDSAAGSWLVGLRKRVLQGLGAFRSCATYPEGAMLLMRGRPVDGIFVILAGGVKISISSGKGATVILGIARPGEILGLSAAITGTPSEITAETTVLSRLCFVRRDDFLHTLNVSGKSCLQVVELLSEQLREAFELIRIIGGAQSARKKLAALLLTWAASLGVRTERGIEIELHVNEEEIGQMIGASRATVSRLLANLKRNRILSVDGSTLYIRRKAPLEDLAASKRRRATVPQTGQTADTSRLQ